MAEVDAFVESGGYGVAAEPGSGDSKVQQGGRAEISTEDAVGGGFPSDPHSVPRTPSMRSPRSLKPTNGSYAGSGRGRAEGSMRRERKISAPRAPG